MNATDTHDRIVQGFADLLERLRSTDRNDDTAKRIKADTMARQKARNRVRSEYAALGCTPPCDDALSITALRELGYPIPPAAEQAA